MEKKSAKNFIWITLLSLITACDFAPGSYPYAEGYEIITNEANLIEVTERFKMNNPEFNVPEQTELKDGRRDSNDYWYHIYFYYPNENEIVKCWIRSLEKGKTTFSFVGINQGLELGNWRMINKDFSKSENEHQKKKFEERILNKIKEKL